MRNIEEEYNFQKKKYMENIKILRRHNMMTPTEKDKKMQTVLLLNKGKTLRKILICFTENQNFQMWFKQRRMSNILHMRLFNIKYTYKNFAHVLLGEGA